MPRVITIGGSKTPTSIPGQGCLASIHDSKNESWIYEDQSGSASEAAAGVGADTLFPVGLSLDQLMEVYWRWKQPRITQGNAFDPDDVDVASRPASEVDLVLPNPIVFAGGIGDGNHIFGDDPGGTETTITRVKFYDDKYWPRMEVLGVYHFTRQSSAPGSFAQAANSGQFITTTGTVDFVFYTSDIPAEIAGASLVIDCAAFYPHEKPGGGAKYSTTTGARL